MGGTLCAGISGTVCTGMGGTLYAGIGGTVWGGILTIHKSKKILDKIEYWKEEPKIF
jgi:hypothetical protein